MFSRGFFGRTRRIREILRVQRNVGSQLTRTITLVKRSHW